MVVFSGNGVGLGARRADSRPYDISHLPCGCGEVTQPLCFSNLKRSIGQGSLLFHHYYYGSMSMKFIILTIWNCTVQ